VNTGEFESKSGTKDNVLFPSPHTGVEPGEQSMAAPIQRVVGGISSEQL